MATDKQPPRANEVRDDVTLTNLDQSLFEGAAATKRDLVDYLDAVADQMVACGILGILNFALTLEYLESTFYKEAKTRAKASGELKSLISLLAEDEEQHVEALTATIKKLKGKPVAEPKFDFPYKNTAEFLKLAQTFEDTGVSAYNGAGPMIKSKEVLGAAGEYIDVHQCKCANDFAEERGLFLVGFD